MTKISALVKKNFYRNFARMIKAGFSIENSLEKASQKTKSSQALSDSVQNILYSEYEDVDSSLNSDNSGLGIEAFERGALQCAKKSGNLERALVFLSNYFSNQVKAKKLFFSKLPYPLFLLHFCAFAINVQKFVQEGFYSGLFSVLKFWVIIWLACFVVYFVFLKFITKLGKDRSFERAIMRLPLIKKTWKNLSMSRFTLYFLMAWNSGMPLRLSIKLAGEASGSAIIDEDTENMADCVANRNGESLSQLFALSDNFFPDDFLQAMQVAEESGTINEELETWANYFQEEYEHYFIKLIGFISKSINILIMLIVGLFIILFWVKYYGNLFKSIGGL